MATETKLRQLAQGGCPVYYFYSSERYLVRQAVARAAKLLAEGEDEETTVLDGAAPEIEQLIMAAGTISFFGTRRVVLLPEVDPAAYSDKDLDELCATLASLENAVYLTEKRKDTILVRALPVSSRIMGVSGECDLVEFHKCEDGIRLHGHRGMYSVYPVEYKKGKSKSTDADRLQLVAQALCLEEMLSTVVPVGALFYGETRRREVVEITDDLRNEVRDMFEEMHQYYNRGYTPKVKTGKMCSSCSLKELCLPKLNKPASVKSYIVRMLEEGET